MQPKQHNYPKKKRKPRDTSYSATHFVLTKLGKEKLYEIWKDNGHRKTADIISDMYHVWITPMVIQYIAQRKFGWVRIVTNKNLPIYKGVLNGKMPASFYKSIIFA